MFNINTMQVSFLEKIFHDHNYIFLYQGLNLQIKKEMVHNLNVSKNIFISLLTSLVCVCVCVCVCACVCACARSMIYVKKNFNLLVPC